ncbi:hypothetical protein KUTeg_016814 [Tegillarca granosa]|uniref:TTF-type domain-containing protein n=1 Tax=Tegillarca granosa TaxID=220873 RepID=A0ABQ9EMW4_TEGGR|nr:hypothetical protein KUTeg_016814 [Tegillarca granosa]
MERKAKQMKLTDMFCPKEIKGQNEANAIPDQNVNTSTPIASSSGHYDLDMSMDISPDENAPACGKSLTQNDTLDVSMSCSPDDFDPAYLIGKSITDNDKMKLLNLPKTEKFLYPTSDGRKYSQTWENKFPWLHYSKSKDAAFCIECILFGQPSSTDVFCSKGFKDWKNASGIKRGMLLSHNNSQCHQQSAARTHNFKTISSGEKKDILSSLSQSYEENVTRNREILLSIIDTIIVLSQQNIPLRDCDLDIGYLRGQGYDGASVMSGNTSGVKTRIQDIQPCAFYQHCRAHVLNLVLSATCKAVPTIRNLFDSVNDITWFMGASPKRKSIAERYISDDDTAILVVNDDDTSESSSGTLINIARAKKSIPKLCETRWNAQVDTLSTFIAKYKSIFSALQDILDESSSTDARLKAASFMRQVQSSVFIIALIISQHILSYTHPLSQALQKTSCDLFKAYNDAQHCKSVIKNQRSDEVFQVLFTRASTLAECVNVCIEKPRVSGRMAHRAAAGDACDSALVYFRINMFYPFIDHCVAQLEERFPVNMSSILLASKLLPKVVSTVTDIEMAKVFDSYSEDMPSPVSFHAEVEKSKNQKSYDDIISTAFLLGSSWIVISPNKKKEFSAKAGCRDFNHVYCGLLKYKDNC